MRETGQGSAELARLKLLGVDLVDGRLRHRVLVAVLSAHDLPVDELKIDRSFIGRHAAGRPRRAISSRRSSAWRRRSISPSWPRASRPRSSSQFLGELGCELAQGYLFAPALTADALLALLKRSGAPRDTRARAASA